jgi:UDP-2,3-diacylglucosamine pyrophosphatase LpxH
MHKLESGGIGKGNARYRLTEDEIEALTRYRLKTDSFQDLPEWLIEMQDGKEEVSDHVVIEGNTAVLCDVHLGFHDIDAIRACIQFLRTMKVDNIVLNGDTIDAHKLSRWAKRKDDIEFTTELQMARNFIDNLRATFSKARIYFKVGNHEDRLEHYIQEKADQFAGLVTWQSLLELDAKGVKFVDSNQIMFCHGTWITHGHEIKVNGAANPAVTLMNKTMTNTCMGHLHRSQTIHKKSLDGEYLRADVIGTLSKLKRGYMAYSQSNHGFAFIHEDGEFQNIRIEDGKVKR